MDNLRAMAINDFLYLLGQGYPKEVAFERATDGEDAMLVFPSNVRVEVVMNPIKPQPCIDEGSGD